MLINLSNLSN